jgi:hypothetical protein
MALAYGQLVGYFTANPERMLERSGWKEIRWHKTEKKATRLAYSEALSLVKELEARQPGPVYLAVRDENAEDNVPPYGLDNFVVKRIEKPA